MRAANGHILTVPAWMTDKWTCQRLKFADSPVCSLAALRDLADLLSLMRDTIRACAESANKETASMPGTTLADGRP
jgi:hypothetical protein